MPIKIPDNLPAKEILQKENIFVMDATRAFHQDIRPLKIVILNLMPLKQVTEVQLLRMLGNTPLQIDVTLIHMESHASKNTSHEYLETFYHVYEDIKDQRFDGMIITGAPVEHLPFEEVNYWKELTRILDWTTTNVTSTLHICWGAMAGLYHHYGIPKYAISQKMFGVFPHMTTPGKESVSLLRGFDAVYYVPQSRLTEVRKEDICQVAGLEILSESKEAGVYLVASTDGRRIFATGHSEYDPETLLLEYQRDKQKGEAIAPPLHYFVNDDPLNKPLVVWRSHGSLLFTNWLNYYVYQTTPYCL